MYMEFKTHFETLLNSSANQGLAEVETEELPYIPVLDDPISDEELVLDEKFRSNL